MSLELAEGGTLSAALAVAADGRNSIARAAAGIATRNGTTARPPLPPVSATRARTRRSRTELHRRAGPLTTVPLPGDASSLVWVEEPAEARAPRCPRRCERSCRARRAPAGPAGLAQRRRPARDLSPLGPQRRAHGGKTASRWSAKPRTSSRRSERRGSIWVCAMRRPLAECVGSAHARRARTSAAPTMLDSLSCGARRGRARAAPSRSISSTGRCSRISCPSQALRGARVASACQRRRRCAGSSCAAGWAAPGRCRA